MTLNCFKFKVSRNFALGYLAFFREQMFVVDGVTVKNASEGSFIELRPIYQSCRALTFALTRLSCITFHGVKMETSVYDYLPLFTTSGQYITSRRIFLGLPVIQ